MNDINDRATITLRVILLIQTHYESALLLKLMDRVSYIKTSLHYSVNV
jgi:hypothetical protein